MAVKTKKKRPQPMTKQQIEERAIEIVKTEKVRWEVATAFVTDRVSFKMRQLIRILRKNFYGIFDVPVDPATQLEKIWYPLTEINVRAVVKNIDLDAKDIGFQATSPKGYAMTDVTRAHVKSKLHEMGFGQMLDDLELMLAIDGTAVWKTYEEYGKCQVRLVDLLNIYVDPTTPSIQEAYRFTERSLQDPEAVQAMNGWINTENVGINVPEGLPRQDPFWMNRATMVNSNVRMLDVYETWGKIPKSLITGDLNDDHEEVDGHIVVSGIDVAGHERCHLIEKNNKKDRKGNAVKPYEECWYQKVPNRWYGRGVAEMLLTLQIYANIVFNVRINRARISQLGLFKIRKGSGITPAQLSRLPSNGAVVLNNMDDFQQLVVQEVGESSYKDEQVINSISERLTNAFEVVTGEALPASTPATNASIQNQNAKSGFMLVKDGIGQFLERWMDNHALPILAKELTAGELIRITNDEDDFEEIVDRVIAHQALEALKDSFSEGYIPSPEEIQAEMESAKEKALKGHMFVELVQDIMAEQLDTKVVVTNEEMDVPMTVQNLINMLNIAPEYRDAIVKQTFDLLGLPQPKAAKMPPPDQAGAQGGMPPQGAAGTPTPQPLATPMLAGQQMQSLSTGSRVPVKRGR